MLTKKLESDGTLKRLVIASLILNVVLAVSVAGMYVQVSMVVKQNEDLTKQLHSLSRDYNLTQSQLAYYKSQAEYFSQLLEMGKATEGVVGNATVNVVAVSAVESNVFEVSYEGVTMKAAVELRKGAGRILINTQPRIGIDLQTSARTAAMIAENVTGIPLEKTDIILTITSKSEVEVVDGPSAGTAITIAIIASIKHEVIDQLAYMTGTINPDGTIGSVGGIPEKALAAAQQGAVEFLVPKGQSVIIVYKAERIQQGPFVFITYKPYQIDLQSYLREQGYNVKVVEVNTILEAYQIAVKKLA